MRQAVGSEPAEELDWPALHRPETDLLPTVVNRLDPSQISDRAKGLKRYTWLRYQLALKEARKVASLNPDGLLLVDGLHLASSFYEHPSARALFGIDFLVWESTEGKIAATLRDLGWRKPDYPDGFGFSEWQGPESLRLRFHTHWLNHHQAPLEDIFERSELRDGLRTLAAIDQFCRTCWQAPSHLWLVDAHAMLKKKPGLFRSVPEELVGAAVRWNALSLATVGVPMSSGVRRLGSWTPVQWTLSRLHRRGDIYSTLLEELAMQLLSQGKAGWPHHWVEALCRRWALSSPLQLPAAFWSRWRGDFA